MSIGSIALVVAVALAFADASIVVLALPEIYSELHTTIVGVSWVITAYALVVGVGALLLAPFARRANPRLLVVFGLALFAFASFSAGASHETASLMVARCLQGAGAALMLGASLPVLTALQGSAAAGPATLGGCRRDRRRDRPGRGWSAHAGLRLAGDLLPASAGRGPRARGSARGSLSQAASPVDPSASHLAGRIEMARRVGRPRARVRGRRVGRRAVPRRPPRRRGVAVRATRRRARRERAPGGDARSEAARARGAADAASSSAAWR